MELLRITRTTNTLQGRRAKRATLIHRQYNRDWGTSYSRPRIDPYLTSPLLQNPGGATDDQVPVCPSQVGVLETDGRIELGFGVEASFDLSNSVFWRNSGMYKITVLFSGMLS